MNRRNFLSLAALAIAGKAAERVFPFRVYSIPKRIVAPRWLGIDWGFESSTTAVTMQMLVGTPPALFCGTIEDMPDTATAIMARHERELQLLHITPEIFRKAQKQIMERLGTNPLEINSYPLL